MLLPRLIRRLVVAPLVVVIALAFIVLSPFLALLALVFGLAAWSRPGRMRSLRLTCFALIWLVAEAAALFVLLGVRMVRRDGREVSEHSQTGQSIFTEQIERLASGLLRHISGCWVENAAGVELRRVV